MSESCSFKNTFCFISNMETKILQITLVKYSTVCYPQMYAKLNCLVRECFDGAIGSVDRVLGLWLQQSSEVSCSSGVRPTRSLCSVAHNTHGTELDQDNLLTACLNHAA